MTGIYLDLLDAKRAKAFKELICLVNQGGVLAGGTALSLQIKHRYSFDFDIFFNKPKVEEAFNKIKQNFKIKEIRVNLADNKTVFTKDDIQLTLFYYEFKPLYTKIKTSSLPLLNKKDIALDKAYTLGRRSMWRDYVDLFFLLKEKHLNLERIIKDAERKFKTLFDAKLFLEQLTYFADIESFKIKFIKPEYSSRYIQDFLKKEARSCLRKELML